MLDALLAGLISGRYAMLHDPDDAEHSLFVKGPNFAAPPDAGHETAQRLIDQALDAQDG